MNRLAFFPLFFSQLTTTPVSLRTAASRSSSVLCHRVSNAKNGRNRFTYSSYACPTKIHTVDGVCCVGVHTVVGSLSSYMPVLQ